MFQPLNNNQRRSLVDASQNYEALRQTRQQQMRFNGTMRWKKSNGNHYLFHGKGGAGLGRSLGRRNAETEAIKAKFDEQKATHKQRLASLEQSQRGLARYIIADQLGRLDKTPAQALRALAALNADTANPHFCLVGTHALYAYELMAAGLFEAPLLASLDIDLLFDAKQSLRLATQAPADSVIALLQKADPTFQRLENSPFRAVNVEGFMVDLIAPPAKPPGTNNPKLTGQNGDLEPVEIGSMEWLVSAPKVHQIVYGRDGFPVSVWVPDPRVFALHKWHISQLADRDPVKKGRDASQAQALISVIQNHMPAYPFNDKQLQMLPAKLRQSAREQLW